MDKLCGIGTRVVRCSLFTVTDAGIEGFMRLEKAESINGRKSSEDLTSDAANFLRGC